MSLCSFGSRADLDRLHEGPLPTWIQQGEGVIVTSSKGYSKPGVVQFIGTVHFASGIWIGVELDNAEGLYSEYDPFMLKLSRSLNVMT